jgi:NADPH2:quinone reductase
MNAVRVHQFGEPSVMQVEQVTDPRPEPGQVVVRVHAAGVNPVETYIRSGVYAARPPLPYTPGTDAAGVIASVGDAITRFAPGDRVYTSGTISGAYAEQALCWEHQVHPLPECITFAQGAAVNIPCATAYRALFGKGNAQPGETVLIHGASGGVGTAAVQIARSRGLRVIGTAGTEEGRRLVLEQGADHAVDHRAPDAGQQILDLTHGKGVDVILEMLANVNLGKDLGMLASGGRVVVIGSRGNVEITPRDIMARDAAVLGMVLFNTPEKELAGIHAALVAALRCGALRPVVRKELPLAEAPRAHEEVMAAGAHGKIVLIP